MATTIKGINSDLMRLAEVLDSLDLTMSLLWGDYHRIRAILEVANRNGADLSTTPIQEFARELLEYCTAVEIRKTKMKENIQITKH